MKKPYDEFKVDWNTAVSNIELNSCPARVRAITHEDLSKGLAERILHKFPVQEFPDNYHTTFRMEAYVIPVDEFYKILQEEAMRLAGHFNRSQLDLNKQNPS